MAKNNLDPEELFRKSEDEMSDIEKMMAEILTDYEEADRKKSPGSGGKQESAGDSPVYASPAPPTRARKVSDGSASGSRVEKAVPDSRRSAEATAKQNRAQKLEREKKIKEVSKKRSLAPVIVALVLIAVLVVGALVYTKMFEDLRLQRERDAVMQTGTSANTVSGGEEGETDGQEGEAVPEVTFPPDMIFPTPEPEDAVSAGNVVVIPPPDPIVILSDTRTPEPAEEGSEAVTEGTGEEQAPHEHTYQFFKEDKSWTEAQQACKEKGGYLAVVRNEEELRKVVALAQQNGIEKVWLGCHRENGELVWENGETVTFYAWGTGEPSMYDNGDKVSEDYLLLWHFNGAWVYNDSRNDPVKDYPGMYSGQIGYVCEYE